MTIDMERLVEALEDRYAVERELGEGGMAHVFLAEDLKHHRKVAIKVLKPELAAVVGGERFLSEIETTANLQHPHILPLFDSGEADGFLFYVMPYVEGESLRQKLERERQLPVDQAISLARKVAGALQHAHDRGVLHRDIKPGNILISEGEPLVADFGIALAVTSAGGGRITETGLSLGTPHYMSPEQASGDRSLDPRSDIYALGCVLYEMLLGQPPFPGPTPQSVLARILTARPDRVTAGRPTVAANVDAAVARALEKLPADRFERVADFRKALEDPSFRHAPGEAAGAPPRPSPASPRSRTPGWPTLTAAAVLSGLALWGWLRPAPAAPFRTLQVMLPDLGAEFGPVFALAPSGEALAYVATGEGLALRPFAAADSRTIPGVQDPRAPFFAPDGSAVAYQTGSRGGNRAGATELRWVHVDGGSSIGVASDVAPGGTWSHDGHIYFIRDSDGSIWRKRPQGGDPERLPQPDGTFFFWPQALTGHDRMLIHYGTDPTVPLRFGLFDPRTGEVTPIQGAGLDESVYARYEAGYIFWVDRDFNLLAGRFDVDEGRLASSVVNLASGILAGGDGGGANVAVSADGTLVYSTGIAAFSGLGENLAWLDRNGDVEVLEERLADEIGDFDGLALGPGQRYVAIQVEPPGEVLARTGRREIWLYDTRQTTVYPLTFDGASYSPEWLDSRRVAYIRAAEGASASDFSAQGVGANAIYAQPFDRSSGEELVVRVEGEILDFEPTPSEGLLVLEIQGQGEGAGLVSGLWVVEAGDAESLRPFLATGFNESDPEVSPDGRWLAYVSDESGRTEVYVRAFPGGGRPWPISTGGGSLPRWTPDGQGIFFDAGGRMALAALDFTSGVVVTGIEELYDFSAERFEVDAGFEPDATGQRILVVKEADESDAGGRRTFVLFNVFDEIDRRLNGR